MTPLISLGVADPNDVPLAAGAGAGLNRFLAGSEKVSMAAPGCG